VYSWIENPYPLNIVSGIIKATASISPFGTGPQTSQPASYPDYALAEAVTTTSPTQTTTFTTSGSYELDHLEVYDIQGGDNIGGPQTWPLSNASNTWTPDLTPVISSVTVTPNPLTAGQ
jgi:hypothetical protein